MRSGERCLPYVAQSARPSALPSTRATAARLRDRRLQFGRNDCPVVDFFSAGRDQIGAAVVSTDRARSAHKTDNWRAGCPMTQLEGSPGGLHRLSRAHRRVLTMDLINAGSLRRSIRIRPVFSMLSILPLACLACSDASIERQGSLAALLCAEGDACAEHSEPTTPTCPVGSDTCGGGPGSLLLLLRRGIVTIQRTAGASSRLPTSIPKGACNGGHTNGLATGYS
jgi:hypothetical protein